MWYLIQISGSILDRHQWRNHVKTATHQAVSLIKVQLAENRWKALKLSSSAMNSQSTDLPSIPKPPQALVKRLWTFYILWTHSMCFFTSAGTHMDTGGQPRGRKHSFTFSSWLSSLKWWWRKSVEHFNYYFPGRWQLAFIHQFSVVKAAGSEGLTLYLK